MVVHKALLIPGPLTGKLLPACGLPREDLLWGDHTRCRLPPPAAWPGSTEGVRLSLSSVRQAPNRPGLSLRPNASDPLSECCGLKSCVVGGGGWWEQEGGRGRLRVGKGQMTSRLGEVD